MIKAPTFGTATELLLAIQARGHVVSKQGHSLECYRCGDSWTYREVSAGPHGMTELLLSGKIGDCS